MYPIRARANIGLSGFYIRKREEGRGEAEAEAEGTRVKKKERAGGPVSEPATVSSQLPSRPREKEGKGKGRKGGRSGG